MAKSGTGVLATTRLSPWSVEEGSDVEKSGNKIVVLVIADEALILDLMEEVLADLDVPQKKGVVDLGTFIGTPLPYLSGASVIWKPDAGPGKWSARS